MAYRAKQVIEMKIANGTINKVLVARLQRGEDVIEGIKKVCQDNGVKNAVIISMIGSLYRARYTGPINDPSVKCGTGGTDIQLEGPIEMLTGQGEICHKDDGELSIHIHATFTDSKGNAYGGHLFSDENEVLNTLNVFIGVIEGVDMGIELDKDLDIMAFSPRNNG
jgi:predicted DNA-binding protein with PD1-like motif